VGEEEAVSLVERFIDAVDVVAKQLA